MTTSSASRINERKGSRGFVACLLILGLLAAFGSRGIADSAGPETQAEQLQARLDRLVDRDDAKHASYAIEQARGAMEAASDAQEPSAARRAHQIARAAMVLAERQLERRKVREELLATQQRLTATRERAIAQRRVLDALMRERASLALEVKQP